MGSTGDDHDEFITIRSNEVAEGPGDIGVASPRIEIERDSFYSPDSFQLIDEEVVDILAHLGLEPRTVTSDIHKEY